MMNLTEDAVVVDLADVLYDFLPGSGNRSTAFPLAAAAVGVGELWEPGSKRPAIVRLLTRTLREQRGRFCPLILQIVRQSMTWRKGKGNPLTRAEVERLNLLLRDVSFKIPELNDAAFLARLDGGKVESAPKTVPLESELRALATDFVTLSSLNAHERGFRFEKFLALLFDLYGLKARSPFRLVGEQIDGSFELGQEVYLLEAKWVGAPVGADPLYSFVGKVTGKAVWSRGLFISYNGFSEEGLTAFRSGRATPIICMDGLDLHETLSGARSLPDVISRKVRRAGETGNPFVRVRDLF